MIFAQAMMAAPFVLLFVFMAGTLGSLILITIYNLIRTKMTERKGIHPAWSFLGGSLLVVYLIISISISPSIT